jgi:hypothetical protein
MSSLADTEGIVRVQGPPQVGPSLAELELTAQRHRALHTELSLFYSPRWLTLLIPGFLESFYAPPIKRT